MYSADEREAYERDGQHPGSRRRAGVTGRGSGRRWVPRRRLKALTAVLVVSALINLGLSASAPVYAVGQAVLSLITAGLCWVVARPVRPAPILVGLAIGAATARALWTVTALATTDGSSLLNLLLPAAIAVYVSVVITQVAREPVPTAPA